MILERMRGPMQTIRDKHGPMQQMTKSGRNCRLGEDRLQATDRSPVAQCQARGAQAFQGHQLSKHPWAQERARRGEKAE
jgi:hypothetical protein